MSVEIGDVVCVFSCGELIMVRVEQLFPDERKFRGVYESQLFSFNQIVTDVSVKCLRHWNRSYYKDSSSCWDSTPIFIRSK